MTITIPRNKYGIKGILLSNLKAFVFRILVKRSALFITFSGMIFFSTAQSVSPSTINISGQSAISGNYQFEWSVGEATSIITTTSSNLVVTSGVLQSFAAYQPPRNTLTNFLPDEVKVYPNPTKDIIEINLLVAIPGKTQIELFDLQGRKLMTKIFLYNGMGNNEKWDLSKFSSGQYLLNVQLFNPLDGKVIKQGTFKILKIK